MLLGLTLKNFAIVDDISINFGSGLNIITGETGAGKSIILNAINFILGDRASSDLIKSGEDEAQVEALFDVSDDKEFLERLSSLGIQTGGSEVLIKRGFSASGKGRVYINGNLGTIGMLDQITNGIIDVFSQHEHQSLLKEGNQLKVLDEFGGLNEMCVSFSKLYRSYVEVKKELEQMRMRHDDQVKREDFLRYQCDEIDSESLKVGEDHELEREKLKLSNAERLYSVSKEAYEIIYESEESIIDKLKRVRIGLDNAAKVDESLSGLCEAVERAMSEIEDTAFSLRDYFSEIQYSPDRLSQIEDRLQDINRLKRKYGNTIEEIIEKRREMGGELLDLTDFEEKEKRLEADADHMKTKVDNAARELSKARLNAAERLSAQVERGLEEVGIKGGKLIIDFDKKEISSNGYDKITFLFSANPDEKPRPLSRVASGGELSRIMLVLKEVISRAEGGSILIFDEADSGIGGAVAETVGKKIKSLSKRHQVICITHLPQVAKFANTHFKVTKEFQKNSTKVNIKALDQEETIREIARMLGGIKITEKTLAAAREMFEH
ncbi:MAG: DNA repair protein RecN [Deltaproteobacteria bacterium]|nr:DNA repair protein RecN [Deltaproteobacteria bacterium]